MTQTQQLLERYGEIMKEIAEGLTAELARHGCPNLSAQYLPDHRHIQLCHSSQQPTVMNPGYWLNPSTSLVKLAQAPVLEDEYDEEARIAQVFKILGDYGVS
ncbi:MAG: hypothetical protein AAF329_04980 [Cyanobacteria bacterium P01_A01_bin.17]